MGREPERELSPRSPGPWGERAEPAPAVRAGARATCAPPSGGEGARECPGVDVGTVFVWRLGGPHVHFGPKAEGALAGASNEAHVALQDEAEWPTEMVDSSFRSQSRTRPDGRRPSAPPPAPHACARGRGRGQGSPAHGGATESGDVDVLRGELAAARCAHAETERRLAECELQAAVAELRARQRAVAGLEEELAAQPPPAACAAGLAPQEA
ncbi:unnamed protein product [Prorocentrum cordatum]|uniref:Uncharacterized protein n=1 Tax=Prorocentrum cordatum TaxID=2364126 RepID=A0ABN9XDZ3_9DINO|nr:unnamed protein product [Polarella glacialis]